MTTMPNSSNPYNLPPLKDRLKETFYTYFKFGYTTFGGPSAHIAILYDDIVTKRKWISSEQFTELFAICQALPGPASTELAYSLIPGAIVMTVAGVLIGNIKGTIPLWATRLEQGLASAAIGLVALAAYRMSTALATDKLTRILALVAGSVSVLYTAPWLLPVMMIVGGITSYIYDAFLTPFVDNWKKKREQQNDAEKAGEKDLEQGIIEPSDSPDSGNTRGGEESDTIQVQSAETNAEKALSVNGSIRSRGKNEPATPMESLEDIKMDTTRKAFSYTKKLGLVFFLIFLALLIAAILARALIPVSEKATYGQLVSTFYFVGSIIFGGGPVIIPLLKTYTVDSHWMTDQQFLVGLAIIQSLPGPNFNFACFLGAVAMVNANQSGVAGATLGYLAIFFPGLILKNAIIPFWQYVREHPSVKMVFRGVNACALGLVFSATWLLWIQTNSMGGNSGYHAVIASAAFVAAGYLDIPSPLVIVLGGGMGAIEYAVSN
ncbi:hypothetical protein BGZ80_000136 [Entomortierella chlamydospora]|uniref:Chromate ion transporter n=1 Tax=Entomortierella chlamydospora TaxID=101097 RepID=A0A9P6SYP2_9FUNG|nr:hypothetical protein BGZ80_000136 [Entomortierella chlamydospora]